MLATLTDTLPRPVVTATAPSEPARTDTERALAGLLTDLLAATYVGRHDDFFTLGGDSIPAVQLAARARDAGGQLTARMVFEHPVLAEPRRRRRCEVTRGRRPREHRHPPCTDGRLRAVSRGAGRPDRGVGKRKAMSDKPRVTRHE